MTAALTDPTEKDRETARELNDFAAHCYAGGGFNDRVAADKRTAQALASARSEASGGWIPASQARDCCLFACVSTDEPIVTYDFLVFVDGKWIDPDNGSTCDAPDLVLKLPALPRSSS